jgi:hypothetical protein
MTTTVATVGTVRINDADAVMDALRGLLPSALPAVVFTRLAAASVPTFSDRCHIRIDEDGLGTYRIERPRTGTRDVGHPDSQNLVRDSWSGQLVGDHMVQTTFDRTNGGGLFGYKVSVLHLWNGGYRPTGTDVALAQLAVDHAVAILHREQAHASPSLSPATVERP